MITDYALSLGLLMERERKLAAIEKGRQHEFARTGTNAGAPRRASVVSQVVKFVQSFRHNGYEAAPSGATGEAAA